jgi:hypothetical protein
MVTPRLYITQTQTEIPPHKHTHLYRIEGPSSKHTKAKVQVKQEANLPPSQTVYVREHTVHLFKDKLLSFACSIK